MKTIFVGRYNESEILTGPEKVAKRIFNEHTKNHSSFFIEYFFDGNKYSVFKKLFGSEEVTEVNGSPVLRKGILSFLIFLIIYKPEIIHIITYERFSLTSIVYKLFSKVKIAYNVHGIAVYEDSELRKTEKFYKRKDEYTENKFFKYSDIILFLSEQSIEFAGDFYKFKDSRIRMISNGVDSEFHNSTYMTREPDRIFKIVFSGDPARKEKGFDLIKEVFYELNFPFRLFLLSSNNFYSENFIEIISLMDTKNYAEFLSDADLIISASFYEPFSIVVAEAMSCGAVPVVSQQTGMSRYITHGKNGFIFDTKNKNDLKTILNKLYIDKELFSQLSQNSRSIYSYLNWKNVYKDYENIYSELLS